MKIMKVAIVFVGFVAMVSIAAHAQTQVFVPGTATGYFGNPVDQLVPFVLAITVSGPGTVTVTYISGTVTDGGVIDTGPNGVRWDCRGRPFQVPLQEGHGVAGGQCQHVDGLIGVFVPQSRIARKGFNALDGTKNVTRIGIMPGNLFFIGEGKTIDVTLAGTLYLGINDPTASDNGGGFNVEVSFQQLRARR